MNFSALIEKVKLRFAKRKLTKHEETTREETDMKRQHMKRRSMKLARIFPLIGVLFLLILTGCGVSSAPEDEDGDDGLFKQGPSIGQRYFTETYDPAAVPGLDGLWVMESQFGQLVDAVEIHEDEEEIFYARRCRFSGGLSLFAYVRADIKLKANYFEFEESGEYTAIPDSGDTRFRCRVAVRKGGRLFFRLNQKRMRLSTDQSMSDSVGFQKFRDN
ncbi:MAG: hypothetical protein AAF202_03375 [Pseudomonadota bacterium]